MSNVERRRSKVEGRTDRLHAALEVATHALLAEIGPGGHWVGELSCSALSTATAVVAFAQVDREFHAERIAAGLRWLAANANADGGWGDTTKSKSNISTTALCWAAFGAAGADAEFCGAVAGAERWLAAACHPERSKAESKDPAAPAATSPDEGRDSSTPLRSAQNDRALIRAIEARYGRDRTFSVPILMTLALSGRLGDNAWGRIPALPFELAALPHQFFGALRLPVVSYALPALIAIGQVIHHYEPTLNPVAHLLRSITRHRTLRVLERIQPPNGGFLEATPLTSFVTMSLAAMGMRENVVTKRGVDFLMRSQRADGSWPIDTNLATWVTTLAIKALAHQPRWASAEIRLTLREWLIGQQFRTEHPYTHAAPGGWAWTDLPGGVPDADDTAGALIALLKLGAVESATRGAGIAGVRWLLGVQNRDGGIPTFCRGWGALPFDRSSPDLTAHALRAWSAWLPQLPAALRARTERAVLRGIAFLAKTQRADGSWLPLWFGNEHAPDDENPTYGTAKVLIALRELQERGFELPRDAVSRAAAWLTSAQDASGGWGGVRGAPSSVEETALAVEALTGFRAEASSRGAEWLIARVETGTWRESAPIGFYFAKLWYHERLYPLIFATGALSKLASHGHAGLPEP